MCTYKNHILFTNCNIASTYQLKPLVLLFLYRENLFMKEKLNKKNNIKTLFTIHVYTKLIVREQINSSTITYLSIYSCLQNHLAQWSWPKNHALNISIMKLTN